MLAKLKVYCSLHPTMWYSDTFKCMSLKSDMMSQIVLHVMAIGKGHEEKKYDSSNKRSLNKMVKYIVDQIQNGFTLYGAKKGEELVKLFDSSKSHTEKEVKQEL